MEEILRTIMLKEISNYHQFTITTCRVYFCGFRILKRIFSDWTGIAEYVMYYDFKYQMCPRASVIVPNSNSPLLII